MLPADWEEYMAKAERELAQRPQGSPKKARPVKKMMSPRQLRATQGTRSTVKAIYGESGRAQTVDPTKTTFTNNLGGNCEPDAPHGKATGSRS
jgi:hypothetical protein